MDFRQWRTDRQTIKRYSKKIKIMDKLARSIDTLDYLDSRENNMKTIEQIRKEIKVGDVFTLEEFMEVVERGSINDYDGFGYFHDGEKETDIDVFGDIWDKVEVDDMLKRYPYVIWYNK